MASEQAAIADNGAPDPPDEDVEEQQVVERDPGGRYGRVRLCLVCVWP